MCVCQALDASKAAKQHFPLLRPIKLFLSCFDVNVASTFATYQDYLKMYPEKNRQIKGKISWQTRGQKLIGQTTGQGQGQGQKLQTNIYLFNPNLTQLATLLYLFQMVLLSKFINTRRLQDLWVAIALKIFHWPTPSLTRSLLCSGEVILMKNFLQDQTL